MRHIRHGQHEFSQARVQRRNIFVGALDLFGDALHFSQQLRGVFAGFFAARDLFAGFVARGFQALDGRDAVAPFAIERAKRVEVDARAAPRGHLLEFAQVLAEIVKVMHGQRE